MSAHSVPPNPEEDVERLPPHQAASLDEHAVPLMHAALGILKPVAERGGICPACANIQAMQLAVTSLMQAAPDAEDGIAGIADAAGSLLGALLTRHGPALMGLFAQHFNDALQRGRANADQFIQERTSN